MPWTCTRFSIMIIGGQHELLDPNVVLLLDVQRGFQTDSLTVLLHVTGVFYNVFLNTFF